MQFCENVIQKNKPMGRERLPTPVIVPEEFHRQRTEVGYSSWDRKEFDMTEQFNTFNTSVVVKLIRRENAQSGSKEVEAAS